MLWYQIKNFNLILFKFDDFFVRLNRVIWSFVKFNRNPRVTVRKKVTSMNNNNSLINYDNTSCLVKTIHYGGWGVAILKLTYG